MSHQQNPLVIIAEGAAAPADAFVVRKVRDDLYRIEETGTEIYLNDDSTLTVQLKFNGKDIKSVPKTDATVTAYSHRASNGRFWRFSQYEGQLVVE